MEFFLIPLATAAAAAAIATAIMYLNFHCSVQVQLIATALLMKRIVALQKVTCS
jgi:hypothetical protein